MKESLLFQDMLNFPEDAEFLFVDHFDETLYQKALDWVGGAKFAAFISNEKKESTHPRIKIYEEESWIQREKILKEIAWSAVLKKMHVVGDLYKEEIEKLHLAAHLILSDAANYWRVPFENAKKNLGAFRRGKDLKGAFSGVPAIVVGAGPSLEKNGHLLRYFKNRALILAGGKALNLIDTPPDFAASVDEAAPESVFGSHPFKDVPFCYQARMNPENLSYMRGEKICFADGASKAINWLYEEDEPFDSGWTVANFLTSIALFFGCGPIIFVGMDLCYQKGQKYAKEGEEKRDDLIEARGFYTQRDWLMSLMWTEEKAHQFDFINATEGGILNLKKQSLESIHLPEISFSVQKRLDELKLFTPSRLNLWDASIKRCQEEGFDGEIVQEMLLDPLWQIWEPVFKREIEQGSRQNLALHKHLFFQSVMQEYG